jgi:hypothetical protein
MSAPAEPVFILESPAVQNAANSVYVQKQAYDAAQAAKGSNKVYQFKTDYERMQYLLGHYGRFSQGLAPG